MLHPCLLSGVINFVFSIQYIEVAGILKPHHMLAAGACSPPSCSHAVWGSVLLHTESCLSSRDSAGRGLILTESVFGCADKYLYRSVSSHVQQ